MSAAHSIDLRLKQSGRSLPVRKDEKVQVVRETYKGRKSALFSPLFLRFSKFQNPRFLCFPPPYNHVVQSESLFLQGKEPEGFSSRPTAFASIAG
ncbi:unnamed protein product [Linum trigynum]|uniref:Uncharacterized protein n=1 Tax=Linum trigynum TaxID=586398 RepID=A0AAV2CBL8_9ROSI